MTPAAQSHWQPTSREQAALARQAHVQGLGRVDQVWPWLQLHHGDVMAVDAPHAAHPERLSYQELAERIDQAAAAFRSLQIGSGDVVGLFAENSPRWLVADQGLMRAGAADAVRGASAPVEELRYILDDCRATALVVQNVALLERLALTPGQRSRLRFVLLLEGDPVEGVVGWEPFLKSAVGQPSSARAMDASSSPHCCTPQARRVSQREFRSPTPISFIRCARWPVWPIPSPVLRC